MQMNKEFYESEFYHNLLKCVVTLDVALEKQRKCLCGTEEYKLHEAVVNMCLAELEVYEMALKYIFGVEFCLTRTDEYFGLVTEDETYFLFQVMR